MSQTFQFQARETRNIQSTYIRSDEKKMDPRIKIANNNESIPGSESLNHQLMTAGFKLIQWGKLYQFALKSFSAELKVAAGTVGVSLVKGSMLAGNRRCKQAWIHRGVVFTLLGPPDVSSSSLLPIPPLSSSPTDESPLIPSSSSSRSAASGAG